MANGDDFEMMVEDRIRGELRRGELGLIASHAKVYRKKRYPSNLRTSGIVVDVSIEVFRENASEPFLIWVWECKDYGRPVGVEDIEEFHTKLDQLGVHRIRVRSQPPATFDGEQWR